MVNLLIAAAVAAASPVTTPQALPAQAEPAMFVVRDADTTVYLFGTFHALDGDANWFGPAVRGAFEQSNELVLETLLPEGPDAAREIRQLTPAIQPVQSQSFLNTTRMAISAGRLQGMQVNNGADMVLRHTAEAEGKAVEGLETLQLQLNMFNSMPPPAMPGGAGAPKAGEPVGDQQSLAEAMAEMQSAWKHGDQGVFVRLLDQLQAGSPDTYRKMFTERNARWADWIAARMQTPGTVFVAVGAGHLAGRDSVLVRLAEKGISSQRVD
jgi:uncharacterized protein YbaP (TraB family)